MWRRLSCPATICGSSWSMRARSGAASGRSHAARSRRSCWRHGASGLWAPEARIMLLAIDSSTDQVGVALLDGESLRGELAWTAGRAHTTTLLPAIAALLELAGATRADLSAVGVATGPGSFNGLRAGLAVAKGCCLAL